MEKDTYKTIKKASKEILLKEKGSKFYGYAFAVTSEEEIKGSLQLLKKMHPSARHFCYAWQLGETYEHYRTNDDGEPSNSAGPPIFGQIQSFNLTQTLVVVVRYFGGTKLGVGGLISAYKDAAKLALGQAHIIEKELTKIVELNFKYELLNTVMRLIKLYDLEIVSQQMALDCQLSLKVPLRIFEEAHQKFEAVYDLDLKVL